MLRIAQDLCLSCLLAVRRGVYLLAITDFIAAAKHVSTFLIVSAWVMTYYGSTCLQAATYLVPLHTLWHPGVACGVAPDVVEVVEVIKVVAQAGSGKCLFGSLQES